MNSILKFFLTFILYPGLAFYGAYLLRDTPYAVTKERIGTNDFGVVKSESYPNDKVFIRTFFIKNLTNFPISSENSSLTYSSNVIPNKIMLSNSGNVSQTVKFSKNKNELFNISLPKNLQNENFFTVSITYNKRENVEDKLILKVTSSNEEKFVSYGEGNVSLDDMLKDVRKAVSVYKTIIITETGLLFYLLLILATWLIKDLVRYLKQRADVAILNSKNKFIK